MSYSTPSSTKILTLATAAFLFVLVDTLSVCEFAMVPGVYILLCSQEEMVTFFLKAQMYTLSSTIIKRFQHLSFPLLLWQGHC